METELPVIQEQDITHINVLGARVHNLKNIDVHIPRNQLVVITGLSGSGKSSLAFDTIFAEGQRRYLETFGTYARQFLGNLERPDVDQITGLSPVISIEQKTTSKSPRSTVGTTTEIYDFLRLMYARTGEAYSYNTGKKMVKFSEDQIVEQVMEQFSGKKISILAPVVRGRKGHYRELFEKIRKQGYLKVRVDGDIIDIQPKLQLDRYKIHDIEIVIDRLLVEDKDLQRIRISLKMALDEGQDLIFILENDSNETYTFSKQLMCPETGLSYEEPSPNTFSFNSPYGACPSCNGLGFVFKPDMDKIIPNDTLNIHDGGLAPIGTYKSNITFQLIEKILQKNKENLQTPIRSISKASMDAILYGSREKSEVKSSEKSSLHISFDGIITQIQKSYETNNSEPLRRWAEEYMTESDCDACKGYRLKKEALWFLLDDKHIGHLAEMGLDELRQWLEELPEKLTPSQQTISREIIKELLSRVDFLLNVGLSYLSLSRPSGSLSGGESQRIRLATQIGSQLQGVTYILDEPSIGLHQRDNQRLIQSLKSLSEIGNTVLVVEHDKDIMLAADYILDIGPGAGEHGGKIVAQGTPKHFLQQDTETCAYLNGTKEIALPKKRRKGNGNILRLKGAKGNNLRNVDVHIPLGTLTCITGVSGSGKSTLINETLYRILNKHFFRAVAKPMPYTAIEGLEHLDKVIEIDQAPIGRTPRSNPATYIGVFDQIRNLFASIPEAKIRGYKPGRFSFNVQGGRCEECEGGGMKLIEMNFLPDVYVECSKCLGKRYNKETLEIKYKGKSISDVLNMTIEHATEFFEHVPQIYRKIKTLNEVGLGYVRLGQSATTLSGGEAQRVKLSEELSKKDTGKTIYILDEPTTGLHFEDIRMLLEVLQKLVNKGNTVLVIEHNLDVVKVADYIVDLGPEGGSGGGRIIATGTPEDIIKNKDSLTGKFLKLEMKK
ncbi:MAG: excinuclease ABC subunit UvrA [Chitinophagales bacterium]|nr:excinuclease ABC subunit UvrA [Chitinophagales bacterium]